MNKNTISWLIRIIIAALFIVSAVAKLYPSPYFAISTFEVKQLYSLGFSESFAPYFSRILIGIEFALGICILINHHLKKITIPATILLLFVFVIHLSYTTFMVGNSGNCGCFGELLPMTPVEAIIKNIIAMGLLIWLFKLLPADGKSNFWLLKSIGLGCVLGLFMLAPIRPVEAIVPENSEETNVVNPIEIDTTFSKTNEIETSKKDTAKVEEKEIVDEPKPSKSGYAKFYSDIDKGKQLLCFFAPGCDHCQETAKELNQLQKKDKNFPLVKIIFMNEEAEKIPDFFNIAGKTYPYKVIDIIPFWNELGNDKNTPGVFYIWNGNIIKTYDGIDAYKFDGNALKKIVSQPYSKLKK